MGGGNLYYALGQKRAANFATAAEGVAGQAEVNRKVMLEFNDMKGKLNAGECDAAVDNAREVTRLMQIPLIQGTLRYANILDSTESPTEKAMAEGAVFAAGILPVVHECNSNHATTIYENMRLTNSRRSNADFGAVKRAFEAVYNCLGISCAEIGGLVDTAKEGEYVAGASPCGGRAAFAEGFSAGYSMSSTSSFMVMALSGVAVLSALIM